MKKQTQIYLALTLLGVILIGLGCGISVFEISDYKVADYNTDIVDADLPPLEMETQILEAPLTGNGQFKLDTEYWYYHNSGIANDSFDIQYDNTLTDKVCIEVSYPKGLYDFYLDHPTAEQNNYYILTAQQDDFSAFRLLLQTAKDGYIISDLPSVKLKLTMSEAQAKNFKLNEERDKAEAIEQAQRQQDDINDLNFQMEQQQEEYQQQITDLQEQYQTELTTIQEEYNTRLQQKDEQINQLQQQLDDVRNSLN